MLPYLAGVANNRAAQELRYMIPIIACVSLGYAAIAHQLGSWLGQSLGRWGMRLVWILVVLLHAVHALPMLEVMRSRQHFAEVAARRMVEVAPGDSLLIGVATRPFLSLLRPHGSVLGPIAPPWAAVREIVLIRQRRGQPIYCCTAPAIAS